MVIGTVFSTHFLVMAAGLLWYIKLLIPSATTHEFQHRKEVVTTIAHTSLTEKGAAKRRVPTIAIAVATLATIVLIGILVYPSSPLKTLFANTNSEVIIAPSGGKQSITIGALLPLSGAWSSVGESEDAAVKIAIKDVNQNFSKSNSNTRVGLIIEDTQTNPAISLEKLKNLAAKGVTNSHWSSNQRRCTKKSKIMQLKMAFCLSAHQVLHLHWLFLGIMYSDSFLMILIKLKQYLNKCGRME